MTTEQHFIKHLLICGVLSLPFISLAQTSTFEAGDEGWTEFDNGGQLVQWFASGGNPGGYIRIFDASNCNGWFEAPAQFLGNKSAIYGGRFEFDIRTELPGGSQPGEFALQLIGGTNLTMFFPLVPLAGRQWTTVQVPLVAGAGWQIAAGTNATEDELRYVLSDLQHLRIDADLALDFPDDITSLDNVVLKAPDEIRLSIRVSQVEVCWNTVSNLTYQVQYRSTLTTNAWLPLGTNCVSGDGGAKCIYDAVLLGEPQKFYRVVATNCAPQL